MDSLDSLDGRLEVPLLEPRKTPGKMMVNGCLSMGRQAQIIPVFASIRVQTDREMKLPGTFVSCRAFQAGGGLGAVKWGSYT